MRSIYDFLRSAVGENHSSAESLPSSTQKGGAAYNRKGAGGGGRRQSVQLDQLTREQIARQILNEVFPPKLIRTPDGQQFIQEAKQLLTGFSFLFVSRHFLIQITV